ncbi:hypothetical protein ACLOJK_005319 [Asimina triloba]
MEEISMKDYNDLHQGPKAMKVENMVKLKEEFDYKSLARRLDIQLDKLIAEHERQQKAFKDEIERISIEADDKIIDAERKYADALEKERLKFEQDYVESIKKLEEQKGPDSRKDEIAEIKRLLQNEIQLRKAAEEEVKNLKSHQLLQWKKSEAAGNAEILKLHKMLEDEAHKKEKFEKEIGELKSQLLRLSVEADETRRSLDRGDSGKVFTGLESLMNQVRHAQLKDSGNEQKASIAKLFEQDDVDVRIHAVKVVANLAAEELLFLRSATRVLHAQSREDHKSNQQKIVDAGGLNSLLMLLRSSEDETIHRVAAGAIANLAMNETNQDLIMAQGGISLLSMTAAEAEDPQTLRMVAGAIANLCGNGNLLKCL